MKQDKVLAMPATSKVNQTVTMKKVENGYTVSVSGYNKGDWKEKMFIAKDSGTAQKIADKFL